jgi:NAD(P)-dependent dehydrogenase (short-subunit alcohol dehydrogenase family)
MLDLIGKNAIITGSSRGIGRAIAEALAEHGANVVVSSRKQAACESTTAAINARNRGRATSIPANIAEKADLQRLVEKSVALLGDIHILVCNAATNPYQGPMASIGDDQFKKIFHNNVLTSHWLVQLVAPGMIARHDGSIIFMSSIGGFRGSTAIGAYNISKAADFQLARNLALELGPHNIRVNCIAPGLIRTDFARALWEDEETLGKAMRNTPLGRIGVPEDIAGAALLLASSAGSYITGQTIVVDGGAMITLGGI